MLTNISIEPIQEQDYEGLIYLFQEFATFEKLPERMTNTVEQMKIEESFFNGFVAKDENREILGYTIFFFAYYTWIGKSLYMNDLYIRKAYRGKGLGTMLINKVIEYAKNNNCHKLRWQVSNWNHPAIRFYKSLGASIDDVERNSDLILE